MCAVARDTVVRPVSIGWRSESSAGRGNSGSSSRNSTPRCARLTSPGRARCPPPVSAACEAEWCGSRNGGRMTRRPPASRPATLWIMLTSSASRGARSGSKPGQPRRQHRLAGARRADQQQVMAAGGGDLHGAAGGFHALHVGQVGAAAGLRHTGGIRRSQHLGAAEMVDQRQQVGRRQDLDAAGPGGLAALAGRADQPRSRRDAPIAAGSTPATGFSEPSSDSSPRAA